MPWRNRRGCLNELAVRLVRGITKQPSVDAKSRRAEKVDRRKLCHCPVLSRRVPNGAHEGTSEVASGNPRRQSSSVMVITLVTEDA